MYSLCHSNRQTAGLEVLFRVTSVTLTRLAAAVSDGTASKQMFGDAEQMLAKLPLAADEYAAASNRLQNANRYHACGERGAASFEIRLMARSLS